MQTGSFRKRPVAAVCASLCLLLASCQANPEGSIVVHKNMENLISEAQTESEGKSDAGTIREEVQTSYETYRDEIEDESLHVSVHVDAEVEVPEVDTLNIYRIKQKPFTQEFVDRAAKTLLGDGPYYDGDALYIATKDDIEEIISYYRDWIQEMRADISDIPRDQATGEPKYTVEEWNDWVEAEVAGLQQEIDHYQPLYESAPDEVRLSDYPADTAMKIKEKESDSTFTKSSVPEGAEYASLATAQDAPIRSLLVLNDPAWGSMLQFVQFFTPGVYPSGTLSWGETELRWNGGQSPASLGLPDDAVYTGLAEPLPQPAQLLDGDEVTISKEEARAKAEDLLEALGLDDFAFDEGRVASVLGEMQADSFTGGSTRYRRYWVLQYRRTLDGVLCSAASGRKTNEDWTNFWSAECVEIHVNDGGIAGMQWTSPIEVTETVVENAALKPFSEIRDTFETMICVKNAQGESSPYDRSTSRSTVCGSHTRA